MLVERGGKNINVQNVITGFARGRGERSGSEKDWIATRIGYSIPASILKQR